MITLRHTSTMPRPAPPADRALVAALMDATRHLTYQAWEQATGLSGETRARWRNGDIRALTPTTRYKVETYLMHHPAPKAPAAVASMSGSERERVVRRLLTMRAEIDELVRWLRGEE